MKQTSDADKVAKACGIIGELRAMTAAEGALIRDVYPLLLEKEALNGLEVLTLIAAHERQPRRRSMPRLNGSTPLDERHDAAEAERDEFKGVFDAESESFFAARDELEYAIRWSKDRDEIERLKGVAAARREAMDRAREDCVRASARLNALRQARSRWRVSQY